MSTDDNTEPTNIDQLTRLEAKLVEHRQRWIEGHPDIPYGTCLCGCGNPTRLAPKTVKRNGYVKGAPMRYFKRHDLSKSPEPYKVEDRGYESPCWIWQGATRPSNGGLYGTKWHDGRLIPAHRYYYEQEHGTVEGNLHLDHLCRVTLCVRPSHLEAVSVGENVRRGRLSKLTRDQIAEIRQALLEGQTQTSLAERYGVHVSTISRIKRSAKPEGPPTPEWCPPEREPKPFPFNEPAPEIPLGFCRCGCGEQTGIVEKSNASRGWRKGEPMLYIHGHNGRQTSPAYLEEDRGYETPCWIWQHGTYANGYPQININRKPKLAHRYLYQEHYGPLSRDTHLHHLCEQPLCVNLEHLQPLTPAKHARVRKTTKLSEEQVAEMKRLYAKGGNSYRALGERFRVATMTAYQAVNSP